MVKKNRTPADIWALRMLENGVKMIGKIYMWKPTKAKQRWNGRNADTVFSHCMLALICANVLFVIFLFWFVGQMR